MNSFSRNSRSGPGGDCDLHGIRRDRFLHGSFNVSKREAVRNKFPQRIVMDITSHLAHARAVACRLFSTDAKNAHALRAQMAKGAGGHFPEVREVAGLYDPTSQP